MPAVKQRRILQFFENAETSLERGMHIFYLFRILLTLWKLSINSIPGWTSVHPGEGIVKKMLARIWYPTFSRLSNYKRIKSDPAVLSGYIAADNDNWNCDDHSDDIHDNPPLLIFLLWFTEAGLKKTLFQRVFFPFLVCFWIHFIYSVWIYLHVSCQ